jgi:glycosyltransferase involved in cell wall biosynthesis
MDVSLICPCYNSASTLPRLISSLENQDFEGEAEFIFVLDPSRDSSKAILSSCSSPSFRLIANEERKGVVASRMQGIEAAKGTYVGFVDADDFLEPDFLSKMVSALKDNEADVANCSFYIKDNKKEFAYPFARHGLYSREEGIKKLLMDCSVRGFLWCKMFKRELLLQKPLLLFPSGHGFEDMPYCFSAFAKATKVVCLKSPLYHYSKEDQLSISSRKNPNRAQEHLDSFACMRAYCEYVNEEKLLKCFLASKVRSKLTLSFDLSKSEKDGLSKAEAKRISKEFALIYKKGKIDFSSLSVFPLIEKALIKD